MLTEIFGLPTHVLVVHAVVVLVPLAAIGAVIMAASHRFSARFGPVFAAIAVAGFGAAVVARLSGENLAPIVGVSATHLQAGNVLPWIVLPFAALVVTLWLADRGIPGNRKRPLWVQIVAVLVIAASILATGATIRTGHTGSESVWSGTLPAE